MTIKEQKTAYIEKLNHNNDGYNGIIFELSSARAGSHKICVSKQGQVDVFVKVIINGKVKYVPAECKTNGGRVNDLLDGSNKSRFVIYKLDFTQKHKTSKNRHAKIYDLYDSVFKT